MNWLRELASPPFHSFISVFVAVASLILVVDYAVGRREGAVAFQAAILLVLAILNILLFLWEVYLLKTRRIRHLLANLEPLINVPCPWTPDSYPPTSIMTLRGHFTVPTLRDGVLVNLPTSLLVKGDIIQLYHGMPTPANVALLDSSNTETNILFAAGDTLPSELFKIDDEVMSHREIRFVKESKALRFVITETPILSILETTVIKKRPKSLLTKEKDFVLIVSTVLVGIVFLLTLFIDVIKYVALSDDFSGSGAELLLSLPTYSVLPLLHLPLPIVWTILNLYGTARIMQLVEHGPLVFQGGTVMKKLRNTYETFKQMLKLLFQSSKYPNYRIFHILGNLTSCCAVDKEYILTSGSPTPEKVFFLRCTKATEESASEEVEESSEVNEVESNIEDERESQMISKDDNMATLVSSSNLTLPSSSVEVESSKLPAHEEDRVRKESDVQKELTFELHSTEVKPKNKSSEQNLMIEWTTEEINVPRSTSAMSTVSDPAPFEVITEILDLSPSGESASGLCFDDINSEVHISSLKPIGVNLVATSHFISDLYHWYPSASHINLQSCLNMTSCACSLGIEIGVTEYSTAQFEKQALFYSVGNLPDGKTNTLARRSSTSLLTSAQTIQPHMLSVILHEASSENCFLMSRGSGDTVASCCSEFWDGKDLQPMTDLERSTVLDFFNRRSLTSYCVALAYNPLLELNKASLKDHNYSIFVPNSCMYRNFSDISGMFHEGDQAYTAEQVFGCLQCNQVFLGMVSFQFQPKSDVVLLIEHLENAGIRFVHFTAENEVRGKIFAEKLGLEAGWNCHISLMPAEDDAEVASENEREFGSLSTSSTSSLSSVYNAFQSYIRAKLPKGVDKIRPHIKNVDNVPLLVPLFTDCSTEAIREMIEILQENSEVVLCIGNACNRDNLIIFAQADISLSLIPEYAQSHNCPLLEPTTPKSSLPSFADYHTWPTPLEIAAYLNSTTCQLSFCRDSDVSICSLVTESRHILSCIRRGLLFALGSFLSLAMMMLLASLFFLPPPLDGSHLFWFILWVVPIITLSFLPSPMDPRIKSQMPDRKKRVWSQKGLFLFNFTMTFVPTVVICVLLFGLTLAQVCAQQGADTDCHPLLGNRNLSNTSSWNGWRSEYEQGLLFTQDLIAFFFTIYLVALSVRFIHRTEPLWKLRKFVSWPYITVTAGSVLLQLVYFAISQSIAIQARGLAQIAYLSSVPFYVWIIGFLWPFFVIPIQELLKYQDKKMFVSVQRHQRLEFETKLGMNSPF